MPGLKVIPDSSHVFETPAGRLIEVRAAGTVSAAALETFYRDTMPALGWSRGPDGSFVRTNEVLVIERSGAGRKPSRDVSIVTADKIKSDHLE